MPIGGGWDAIPGGRPPEPGTPVTSNEYMTGTLEFQIRRILLGHFTENERVKELSMLFRERERLRLGNTVTERNYLKQDYDTLDDYAADLEAALRVIKVIASGEDSKGMNAITTITEVFTDQEDE